ncbi:hypothetical protein [Chryseobacterium sp. JK1]|uniref:hypothetical protein n=1 Tax=Chryseobacterium sp. JK1 TaxID=874294 RepID=UPI003D69D07C
MKEAKAKAPKLIVEGLKAQNLALINQDNLLHGKDSEGGLMPLYSKKYRRGNLFYADYKNRSNPLSKRRWDLKHSWDKKFDGLFYRSIKVTITDKQVKFDTNYSPEYMKEIYYYKSKSKILGITKQQFIEVQLKNKLKVGPKLKNIINKRS